MAGPAADPSSPSAAWDERYRARELVWGAGPNRFLVEELAGLAPGTALDAACGEGRNAIWLAEQGWKVTGADFSPVGLAKAADLAASRGVEVAWVEADLTTWQPPAAYDLIVVMYLHLPAVQRRSALETLARHVSPGGTFLLVGHDLTNLTDGHGGPQDPEVLYGPDDVVSDLGPGLTVERAARVRRPVETPDGTVEAIDVLVRGRRVAG